MRTRVLTLLLLSAFAAAASAQTTSYTGSLDPNNADDVFITTFFLPTGADVEVQTFSYGGGTNAQGTVISSGGFDPYLSIFQGSGPTATFVGSDDDDGCPAANAVPVCEDARAGLSGFDSGTYTIALTLPSNYSIAENYGYGTLGDGFINLQADYYDAASNAIRSSNYAFDVTISGGSSTTAVTPEPNSLTLLATGLLAPAFLLLWKRKHSLDNPTIC